MEEKRKYKRKRKKGKSRRECLRCERFFMSRNIGNRICPSCLEVNGNIHYVEYEVGG